MDGCMDGQLDIWIDGWMKHMIDGYMGTWNAGQMD